jgi:NAD(P)-dependent dehydrogenase (short-subunit alcohol dehydrogenase family)
MWVRGRTSLNGQDDMDLAFRGKRALVTGASRGIGRAIAEGLAGEGADLVLTARNPAAIREASEAIRSQHRVVVESVDADLATPDGVAKVAAAAGKIDILVNNAGAIPNGTIEENDLASWRTAWDLKVFGYIALTREFYPSMLKRGKGVILNIIGMAGERPSAGYIMGSTGNAALYTFTKALGADSFDRGVRVLAVSPGYIETDRQRNKMMARADAEFGDKSRWREFASKLPQHRLAEVREVSDVVVFLVSDRASFVSGTVITVDGGIASRPMPL